MIPETHDRVACNDLLLKEAECSSCHKKVVRQCMAISLDLSQTYSYTGDLDKSAGAYKGRRIHICYECWLRSMGVSDLNGAMPLIKNWKEKA